MTLLAQANLTAILMLRNPVVENGELVVMARLPTLPYHGYAVEFSPFEGSTLAVAGAVNYGIAG